MSTDKRVISNSIKAAQNLADRSTPFIFDCWYVAGFSQEFSRTLLPRTILGRPLTLFRTEGGEPRALSDRCIHRSYPLSRGTLDGDSIVCGYHGLRYGDDGTCTEAPAIEGPCPRGLAVRAYPLREQRPLVWIWMGDGAPDQNLPTGDWIGQSGWPASTQYHHLDANYIALHENLLDLSHLTFLHAQTFGTPDYAEAPYELALDDQAGHFKVTRSVVPTRLPPVWAEPLGLTGVDAARITTSEFLAPSAHVVTAHFYAVSESASPPDTRIRTSHLPTPETAHSTHYFIHHARNFAVGSDQVTDFMDGELQAVFHEDVTGLVEIEQLLGRCPENDRFEISLASDRAGIAARRRLYKLARSEDRKTLRTEAK